MRSVILEAGVKQLGSAERRENGPRFCRPQLIMGNMLHALDLLRLEAEPHVWAVYKGSVEFKRAEARDTCYVVTASTWLLVIVQALQVLLLEKVGLLPQLLKESIDLTMCSEEFCLRW